MMSEKLSAPRRRWGRRALTVTALTLACAAPAAVYLGPRALVEFDLYQARRAMAEVDLMGARDWLQAAQLRQLENAQVQYLLSVVHRRGGQLRPAQRHLDRAEKLGWSQKEVDRQRMMLQFQMGQIKDAEPLLTNVLQRGGPDDVAEDVYEAMIVGYMQEFRVDEAGMILEYWLQWRPESIRARLLRAHLYGAMSDTARLQGELREILRIAPGRWRERLTLAQALLEGNQVDQALAECEACRQQGIRDARLELVLGLCHYKQGRIDDARRELESAVAQPLEEGSLIQALVALGQIAAADKQFERATRYFEQAQTIDPYDAAPEYGLGMALSRQGKHDQAQTHLERSQGLGAQAARLGDIQRQLAKVGDDVNLRIEAARILLDQGQKAKAASWMLSVLEADPNSREANEVLADFYEERGQPDLAQRHRDAAANSIP